ncbi:hypothetical protein NP493_296g02045 [Ridgeia piscesae]|uniref:Uncharacterized protein n=1 Tax=Ridgeia piscesae TaxID=27915 RepID=A0AAD9UC06_RIDPI|nr:hypothetical protein NP493_296g02045 [Ridgeia piscesae]
MSMLQKYKQPKLWGYVSQHFVIKGELDVSKVLTVTNFPDVIYILTSGHGSGVTANITKLDFCDNGIFSDEAVSRSLGTSLATMSQLTLLRMPQCCLTDGSFRHIADGLLRGCPQMTLLNVQRNKLTETLAVRRVFKTFCSPSAGKIDDRDIKWSVGRMRTSTEDRIWRQVSCCE